MKEVNKNTIDEAHIIESKWIRKGEELDIRVSKSNVTSFERFLTCVKDQVERINPEDRKRAKGLFEVFDVMRNAVDDDTANLALKYLQEKHNLHFKVYIFCANNLTEVPKYL